MKPTPLQKLKARWLIATKGEPMPESIAKLPIGQVLDAVERTEDGQTVFVPTDKLMPRRIADDSMREWDCDSVG